jgi:hypothetical protein
VKFNLESLNAGKIRRKINFFFSTQAIAKIYAQCIFLFDIESCKLSTEFSMHDTIFSRVELCIYCYFLSDKIVGKNWLLKQENGIQKSWETSCRTNNANNYNHCKFESHFRTTCRSIFLLALFVSNWHVIRKSMENSCHSIALCIFLHCHQCANSNERKKVKEILIRKLRLSNITHVLLMKLLLPHWFSHCFFVLCGFALRQIRLFDCKLELILSFIDLIYFYEIIRCFRCEIFKLVFNEKLLWRKWVWCNVGGWWGDMILE